MEFLFLSSLPSPLEDLSLSSLPSPLEVLSLSFLSSLLLFPSLLLSLPGERLLPLLL